MTFESRPNEETKPTLRIRLFYFFITPAIAWLALFSRLCRTDFFLIAGMPGKLKAPDKVAAHYENNIRVIEMVILALDGELKADSRQPISPEGAACVARLADKIRIRHHNIGLNVQIVPNPPEEKTDAPR